MMTKSKALFVILLLCICVFSCNSDNKNNKKYKSELFNSLFQEKYKIKNSKAYVINNNRKEIEAIINKILDSSEAKKYDVVLDFIEQNELYREYAIEALIIRHDNRVIPILKNITLTDDQMKIVGRGIKVTNPWHNDEFYSVIKYRVFKVQKCDQKGYLYNKLAGISNYRQTLDLLKILDSESCLHARKMIYYAQTRYKDKITDNRIRKLISKNQEPISINYILKYGLKRYNRHDYLPELYDLKKRLAAEIDILKIEDAKKTIKVLDEVIPYLEQKKKEGAPTGLPLDWGKH